MKKLFSAIAISFVLSGCMNNVSLPNANTPMQPSNQTNIKIEVMKEWARNVAVLYLCGFHHPKEGIVWNNLAEQLNSLALKYYNEEPEHSAMKTFVLGNLLTPYMIENNISLTANSYTELQQKAKQDKNLENKVTQAALKVVPKSVCSIQEAKKLLKSYKDTIL
ncbi:hypothetical protein Q7526_08925 [Glaesserella parasuis]|nr:hypothetical protein [Glaesserella parasuis]MDD2165561.1 hypothetical protein [Glaesserella parasuis]MDO9797317.1 hypothetical protein [Glaesserella parasuis]MDO9892673.1 hypothetical protein [Glaesserella parasuis]MDO9961439.1 hypothetical protein [Glaesserella parasuis]